MIIYKIENLLNGKCYIGQTIRPLNERLGEHLRHSSYIGRALNKYGIENFDIREIDAASTIEELNKKEIYYINEYNTIKPHGYNLCGGGGNTTGFRHSEMSKQKMSKTKKGKYLKEDNPFYGKKHTEETRQKMKEAWKTRVVSEAHKEKLKQAHYKLKVINLDTLEVFDSLKDAAASIGVNSTQITRVCKGKAHTSKGFRWQYYDEYMAISCQDSQE